MNPPELESTRGQHAEAVGLRPATDPERRLDVPTAQPDQARLNHLFRHAGDAPANRFLQDLVTRYRKPRAA